MRTDYFLEISVAVLFSDGLWLSVWHGVVVVSPRPPLLVGCSSCASVPRQPAGSRSGCLCLAVERGDPPARTSC